jgi:general secretion pathway protein J
MKRQRGFTLLEVIVAAAIVVVIGAAASMKISQVATHRERVEARAAELAALQRSWTLLAQDIEQVVARPARDALGDAESALQSSVDGGLHLTRAGWSNPFALRARSNLQRVHWFLLDGVLYREYWPYPDRAVDAEPVRMALLEAVQRLRVRYLVRDKGGGLNWQDDWPPAAELQRPALTRALPEAVSVEIETTSMGSMTRFFRVVANPHAPST